MTNNNKQKRRADDQLHDGVCEWCDAVIPEWVIPDVIEGAIVCADCVVDDLRDIPEWRRR